MPEQQHNNTKPLITFRKVRKAFGTNTVLDQLDLDITEGQRLGVIGPSGSGKSTILRLLMTLEQPTAGRITIDDQLLWPEFDPTGPRPLTHEEAQRQHKLRRQIGMVFQHFNLFPHLRVIDNISLAPQLVERITPAEAASRANELLQQVGLEDKANAYPADLSGGQKQRVAIARALAMRPRIMLFDEATSALDPELVGEVMAVIRDLAHNSNMTMLFVTHQIHFIEQVADRVVLLDGGSIVEDGPPEQVLRHPENERTQAFLSAIQSL